MARTLEKTKKHGGSDFRPDDPADPGAAARCAKALFCNPEGAKKFFDLVNALIVALDHTGRVVLINRKGCALLGYEEKDLLGRNWFDTCLPARFREKVHAVFDKLIAGEIAPCEYYENPVLTRSGTERTISWHNTVLTDETGRITGTLGSGEDITDRLAAAKSKAAMEESLRKARKTETISRIAAGVAHDFNNLLTPILGYTELALGDEKTGKGLRDAMKEIHAAASRASDLARRLLNFSRGGDFQRKIVDLSAFVSGFAKILKYVLGKEAVLELRLDPGTAWVEVDPATLEQALINLAANARDAMPKGGLLFIETGRKKILKTASRSGAASPPEEWIALTVRDTGCGMDRGTLSKAPEPFFTTKAEDRGTGLGLAIVQGFAKRHGGRLEIESAPGEGTTVTILLPPAPAAAIPGRCG